MSTMAAKVTPPSPSPSPSISPRSSPTRQPHYDRPNSPQQQPESSSSDTNGQPIRPSARPFKRANLSLEQNPFEVSFSQSSTGGKESSDSDAAKDPNEGNGDGPSGETKQSTNPGSPKPTLPPLSAIAEPVHQENQGNFPWGFSAALHDSSLRSGPLSPAMLPGPRTQDAAASGGPSNPQGGPGYFDAPPLSFRTGLTPGIVRTGLTPLVGGPASFPPPSPGTAAFLAMVTNASSSNPSQANQGPQQAVTPNTLSQIHPHPLSVSHYPNGQYQPTAAEQAQQQGYRPQLDNYQGSVQNAAAAAANGLFLLSQAHQELTKREEQLQAANAPPKKTTTTATTANHNKRKSSDVTIRPAKRTKGSTPTPTPTRVSSRRKKSDAPPIVMDSPPGDEEDGSGIDEDDMQEALMQDQASGGGSKKFETEEEKRRNFLERNRMAALKCRQRKKAWLGQLQQQVEYLKTENERLQGTIVSMRDEVTRLSAVVVAHRSCGLGGIVVPGYATGNGNETKNGNGGRGGSGGEGRESPVVGVAPVSVPVSVPQGQQGNGGSQGGYGY